MNNIEIIIMLLVATTLLSVLADKIKIAYPILLVLIGLAIGFIPGLPHVELNPEVVFIIFLPPLLYAAAWTTSWLDFKAAARPISLLATGCVLFTTTLVAVAVYYIVPGFTWPLAFVVGAIVSPPDAVAAAAVTKGLGVPRRVLTILEGESLVNDASGLVAYRYAVAAVVSGHFILWEASIQFMIVATLGTFIGLAVGYAVKKIHIVLPSTPVVDTSLTLLTPYIAYLLAEEFHFSGVLAVVSCGLYLSWRQNEILAHNSRIQALAVWDTIVFILNGIIFILIGLQLPGILGDLTVCSLSDLFYYALAINFVVIVVRMIWVFPGAYVPRWFSKKIREREPGTNIRTVTLVGWAGMRGVVSLAAAMALPVTMPDGSPFPQRDMILFLTFSVILFTLVVQGMSLPYIIKWLGISQTNNELLEEIEARKHIASQAIIHIEENYSIGILSEEALARVKSKYELRYNHLNNFSMLNEEQQEDILFTQFHSVQEELIKVERKHLSEMKKKGLISEEVLRKLEYELDLEESRLTMEI